MEELEFKLRFLEMKNKCFEGLDEYEEEQEKNNKKQKFRKVIDELKDEAEKIKT